MIRLVYASRATRAFVPGELEALLQISRIRNASVEISGVLLHHEGSFRQLLDGERAAVEQKYKRISTDPRHDSVLLLQKSEIEKRSFGEWTMGSLEIKGDVAGLNGFLKGGVLALSDATAVEKLLSAFRDGRFRQAIR